MSQGKLRASLGRGSGALLTQPRAYIIIPYDQAINSSNEQNHYTQQEQQEVRDDVPWQTYKDLTYRSSGKTANQRLLGEVRKSFRSHVISPARVDIDKAVAQKKERDIERRRGFASIKRKPAALKFWVPGTVQIMLWVGQSTQGRRAQKTHRTRQVQTAKKPEKGKRGKIRSRG